MCIRDRGGDPFVFGRGGEEALFLNSLGISVEVIPGDVYKRQGILTSLCGAPLFIFLLDRKSTIGIRKK